MQRLMESEWPGNVRELENIVERAVILSQGGVIGSELVPVHGTGRTVQPRAARTPAVPSDGERPSNTIVPFSEAERRAIGERST